MINRGHMSHIKKSRNQNCLTFHIKCPESESADYKKQKKNRIRLEIMVREGISTFSFVHKAKNHLLPGVPLVFT